MIFSKQENNTKITAGIAEIATPDMTLFKCYKTIDKTTIVMDITKTISFYFLFLQ